MSEINSNLTPADVVALFTHEPLEYGPAYSKRISALSNSLKASGLVVATGESDDLFELYGAVRDEIGASDGDNVFMIDSEGMIPHYQHARNIYDEDEEGMRRYFQRKDKARKVALTWHNEGNPCWTIATEIPHETFDVMEDGEVFSRAIVFRLSDLVAA